MPITKEVKKLYGSAPNAKTFENTNQSHTCGKINTIEEYISEQLENIRPLLLKIRATVWHFLFSLFSCPRRLFPDKNRQLFLTESNS